MKLYTLHAGCCYISLTSSMRESKLGANAVPAGELTYTSWIISPGAYCHIHNHLSPLIPLCVTYKFIAKQHPTQVQLKVVQKE